MGPYSWSVSMVFFITATGSGPASKCFFFFVCSAAQPPACPKHVLLKGVILTRYAQTEKAEHEWHPNHAKHQENLLSF